VRRGGPREPIAGRYAACMSKVDAQRAMREARYAALRAQPPSARRPAPPPEQPTAEAPPGEALPTASPPAQGRRAADTTTPLCGHRSISNKSCQREAGHPEKSHRYK
jgi:hypothetical protein